jgi:predicted nucleic acid-binding protein
MRRTPPPLARRVLIDTSAYFALVDVSEGSHSGMRASWTRLTEERWHTFTTNFIVAVVHALFLTRLGWEPAASFLRQFLSSTTVVRISAADEERGREIIFQYRDKDLSLTDATSFAVMERLRIGTALTLDHHFVQYGFQVA